MKETDIQTSKLDRERDRQTYREIDRHREIERERESEIEMNKYTDNARGIYFRLYLCPSSI